MRRASHCDPARGVFETLLVLDGRPLELDAHLGRLARSVATLFDGRLAADARRLALDAADGVSVGRLRLTAIPAGDGRLAVEPDTDRLDPASAFPAPRAPIELRSFAIDGGFGAHKWTDRALIERAEGEVGASASPLLVDRDGTVLEAARANVFAVRDGVLLTPPADGRIVPGITRRRVLGLARAAGRAAREERISLEDLRAAEEVFLTNSVRGIEPVACVDGAAVAGANAALTAALGAELRRFWLGRGAPAAAAAGAP